MRFLRKRLERMGWSFVSEDDIGCLEFNGYPEEVNSEATIELIRKGYSDVIVHSYIKEINYTNVDTCEEETILILRMLPLIPKIKAKRITKVDTISAAIKRNDEATIIRQEIEAAAEDGVLSDMELEQVQEEMLDELYQKQYEEEKADKESREYAYKFIAQHIWDAALKALDEGNLAESAAIGEVYNQWLEVCEKAGVM